jgi:phytoene dehydrogenase-like protein
VAYPYAALALTAPFDGLFAIRGGAATLAQSLAESIKQSGGKIRLNAPVLRLSYDSAGAAVGVDLLNGETVSASRAVISNLTAWDTYGRLIGLSRTPPEIRKALKELRGWGAYLMYVSMDHDISLPSDHLLLLMDWQDSENFDPQNNQLIFSAAPSWDARAPEGKRAVTVHAFTDIDDWFTFHTDEAELEERDQRMLESCWERMHKAMSELGDEVEVIETATPRSFYEQTRRKLGMVGGIPRSSSYVSISRTSYETSVPNLFIISDTVSAGGMAGLSESALLLADHLMPAPFLPR